LELPHFKQNLNYWQLVSKMTNQEKKRIHNKCNPQDINAKREGEK